MDHDAALSGIPETPPPLLPDDPSAPPHFDWSDFLDFNIDENLSISFPQPNLAHPSVDQTQVLQTSPRTRKRDPRLVCSNFLAGRIPCACPELDEKLEEESGLHGKKRTRIPRAPGGGPVRCQVPDCEADISELKGYHKRHRVCLRCANASSVVLDGESKRYCQQCGKFHVLSDFDEGKRSCRRKLERHNNRRRRKSSDSVGGIDKESEQLSLVDDISGDGDTGKEGISVGNQVHEGEELLDPDGHLSTLCSALGSHSLQTDSVVSFAASGETYVDGDKENTKSKYSLSYCDTKNTFSSVCPAGRISFKLYDWNPAEFPRRLRHQIFQWLASMPVELEGYIRPGCTILTAFIAMPKPMWLKLLEEPARCIKDLVDSPGSMLFRRGTMLVYLNDMIFRVSKDATSVVKIKGKDRAPKLHYIYPTCFEAGKPMDLVACGSYLLQPNFRFLISFAGRYLVYNICVSHMCIEKGDANREHHQLLKIHVPQINNELTGPAFIEVENQSGLSNFIPVLVGDKETCSEMVSLQQKFDKPFSPQEQTESHQQAACEVHALRQAMLSDLISEVAWLLKKPPSERLLSSLCVQRFNNLLDFLIEKESRVILERVLCSLRYYLNNNLVATSVSDTEMRLLRKSMDIAKTRLPEELSGKDVLPPMSAENATVFSQNARDATLIVVPATKQGMAENTRRFGVPSSSLEEGATVPLLQGEVIMNIGKSCSSLLTRRSIIITVLAICVCLGLCDVVLRPQRVNWISTNIQRCLFDDS